MNIKVAVSIPADVLEEARQAVAAGSAPSLSAYVTAALRDYGPKQTLRELLDEMAEGEEPETEEETAWARRALGLQE